MGARETILASKLKCETYFTEKNENSSNISKDMCLTKYQLQLPKFEINDSWNRKVEG